LKLIFDVLAYLKGIQDVGVFVSVLFSIFIFLGQTVRVSHIMEVYGVHLKEHAQRSPNYVLFIVDFQIILKLGVGLKLRLKLGFLCRVRMLL